MKKLLSEEKEAADAGRMREDDLKNVIIREEEIGWEDRGGE